MSNKKIEKLCSKVFVLLVSLAVAIGIISINAYAREIETDITDKVTINSITSPDAEVKDSTDVKDFNSSTVGGNIKYSINLTVDKGTPIETGDIIEIPMSVERGLFFKTTGLNVVDSNDGSIIGEATITDNKIRIKFNKIANAKTAVKMNIVTTVGIYQEEVRCNSKAEVDEKKVKEPTSINKVKFLNKNANLNVQRRFILDTTGTYFTTGQVTPQEGQPKPTAKNIEQVKGGKLSDDNMKARWNFAWNRIPFKYTIVNPEDGKKFNSSTNNNTFIALTQGYDAAYSAYPADKNSYLEDMFSGEMYKNVEYIKSSGRNFGIPAFIDEGANTKNILYKRTMLDGKITSVDFLSNNIWLGLDDFYTKKEPNSGQTYAQFKASLKPGEYGLYKDSNGDFRFVLNHGMIGSKDPSQMYTYGDLCAKNGKYELLKKVLATYKLEGDNVTRTIPSKETMDAIYERIKNLPVAGYDFSLEGTLKKPILRTGATIENIATMSGKEVTAKNDYIVAEINLLTYKDGAAIMKTDAKTGQGLKSVEFKLQEKDATGNWIDTDSQYVKDHIMIVNGAGVKKGERFYTNSNGLINIRGLVNGKVYRLIETKALEGYDSQNMVSSKDFNISFVNKDDPGGSDNKDFTLTNKKSEYRVTYKVIKNPNGEDIPSGSPSAPVDTRKYTFKSTVDVKSDLSFAGYEFIGWHTQTGQAPVVKDNDGSFTMPAKDVELVGYWKKITKEITIKYISEDINMGTVTRPSETLNDTTGISKGSVANEKEGYEFVGWYKQSDLGKTIIARTKAFVPSKESDNKYHEETYVAKFKKRERISVSVKKKWIGKSAEKAVITLVADNKDTDKKLILSEMTLWKGEFKDLYKYDKVDGHKIVYTIKEDPIENYKSEISGDATKGFIVKNTNTEKISVKGEKTWDDNNDQDGKRPTQITVNLLKNGTKFKSVTVKADANGNWKYEFTNLDKYENGQEIKYTVEEEKVEGYETKVEGYNIKNSYTPEKTSISVTKTWDDANDQDGKRPTTIKVQLYADGVKSGPEVELSKDNGWTYTWKTLDKYENGKEIKYTVKEDKVKGYETTIDDKDTKNIIIKNSHKPEKPKKPDTSDHSDIMMQLIMMIGSLLGMVLIARKKIKA